MNSTTAWVFSDFVKLHTITHHFDWATCRKRRSHGWRYTSLLLMYAGGGGGIVVRVFGLAERHRGDPGTMHALDKDPVEV